jgi:hypothetical protein
MIEQYTQEWFAQRLGKITSSTCFNLMVEPKTKLEGSLSDTTKNYLKQKVVEKLTGVQRDYKSDATTHGLMMEAEALDYYANKTGNIVGEAGYIESITDLYGGTPDGFVNHNGIIQVKCPYNYVNHLNYGIIEDINTFKKKYKEYYWQCQSDMLVSGREFCEFVSYCNDMPEDFKMFIFRIESNLEDMELLLEKITMSAEYMNDLVAILENKWKN